MIDAASAMAEVQHSLQGQPGIMAGSAVAATMHDLPTAYSDIDVFCPSQASLASNVQVLLSHGATLDDRFSRVWQRWLNYGIGRFHTNSMRVNTKTGLEVNLVYKKVNDNALTSASSVIESFDFGLLASALDLRTDTLYDFRSVLFPGLDPDGALPLMPNKRDDWRNGFVSQYNGLRQMMRYVKYLDYGYSMDEVRDDLVTGYRKAALYFGGHYDDDKQQLGLIYETIAIHIEDDDIDQMKKASKQIDYDDDLDVIMSALL